MWSCAFSRQPENPIAGFTESTSAEVLLSDNHWKMSLQRIYKYSLYFPSLFFFLFCFFLTHHQLDILFSYSKSPCNFYTSQNWSKTKQSAGVSAARQGSTALSLHTHGCSPTAATEGSAPLRPVGRSPARLPGCLLRTGTNAAHPHIQSWQRCMPLLLSPSHSQHMISSVLCSFLNLSEPLWCEWLEITSNF